jgi:hypothetical protein
LSEDTLIVPEHVELEVLVVIVVVSIASENVTVMLSVIATELWLSAVVETEDTVGAVVSVVVVVLSVVVVVSSVVVVVSSVVVVVLSVVVVVLSVAEDSSFKSLQEMKMRLKRDMRIMYKTLFIFFFHQ